MDIEGTLVKALIHCKLENLKKLIKSLLFAERTMITGQGFSKKIKGPTPLFKSHNWAAYNPPPSSPC